jgi:hypothetical protein
VGCAAECRVIVGQVEQTVSEYVFLDPAGHADIGLVLLVLRATGVQYANQVGGLATEERCAEGFVVPLGQRDVEEELARFFWTEFAGHSYQPRADWTQDRLQRLGEILGRVRVWKTSPDTDDEPGLLSLDRTRSEELTEGWLPVESRYGPGVLLFKNCD